MTQPGWKKLIVLTAVILGGCSNMKSEELKTVDFVDIKKFMGDWYVIANIPTFVETDATNAIESYSWNKNEQRIDIDFHFNKSNPNGELKKYPQKAWIHNTTTNAEWRVQPLWPFKFAYLVLDLAPDYSYTVIGVPSRKYIWIMAREKTMNEETYQMLLKKIKALDYDTTKIQKVPQVW